MAAMLTLVASPRASTCRKILAITIPASIVAIVVTALVQNFIGKPLSEDPVYQQRLKDGLIKPPKSNEPRRSPRRRSRRALRCRAYIFLVGVVMIVATGAHSRGCRRWCPR